MTAGTAEHAEVWVSAAHAARVAGTNDHAIRRLADRGHIRVRRLPGMRPTYAILDVERLTAASTSGRPDDTRGEG